jgi:phenol hydroxylase P1 protein
MHDAFAKSLAYIEERSLLATMPGGWQDVVSTLLVPLRHFESGAQLISVTGARFAYGTSVEQCLSFAAFDRIGNAQMISRIGISMADGSDELLGTAKQSWMDSPALQPLRRMVEELLVERDWVTSTIGLDLIDRLLFPLLYRHLDEAALLGGAGSYSLIAQHFAGWYDDNRRWLDALLAEWVGDPDHGAGNLTQLQGMVDTWLPRAREAVDAIAAAIDAAVGVGAVGHVARTAAADTSNLDGLGIRTEAAA